MSRLIIILISLFSSSAIAEFMIEKVHIKCSDKATCLGPEILKKLEGSRYTKSYLDNLLRIIARQNGIEAASYKLKNNEVFFVIESNPLVSQITITLNDKTYDEGIILPATEGDFFSADIAKKNIDYLKDYFFNLGYVDIRIEEKKKLSRDGLRLEYSIESSGLAKVVEIQVTTPEKSLKKKVSTFFSGYINRPYRRIEFSAATEDLKQILFDAGYYFVDIDLKVKIQEKKVFATIQVKNTQRQAFRIYGVSVKTSQQILKELKNTTRVYKRILSDSSVKEIVSNKLRNEGFYDANFEVDTIDLVDAENLVQTVVKFKELNRTQIVDISFRGNSFFSEEDLREFFLKNGSEKVKNNFSDTTYYSSFLNLLKRKYVEQGFTSVQLREPSLKLLDSESGKVIFKIVEGQRSLVSKVNIPEFGNERIQSLTKLQNLEGSYFNPLEFERIIEELLKETSNLGYYYFKIENLNSSSFVSYSKDNSNVTINAEITFGEKIHFRSIKYFGNNKTKDKLLKKHLNIKQGELVTRRKVREYQSNLLALGIFSNVNIVPIRVSKGIVDLIVQLKETEFGIVELAPGIRSDLGPKFLGTVSYTNLGGMNRVASLKVQVNNRFDLNSISESRRDEEENLIEYETELSFNENKIFNTKLNFFTSVSALRNRFFSTDADIQKINYTFSTAFTKWFRASFTQQLESVSQFNSVDELEEGKYEIGSITPSVTLDFRNNRINPTKGAYFNLSFERASPSLKSQNSDDLKVDYYKFVLRNFFYAPFKNGTFAISLAGGLQENLAKNRFDNAGNATGYIPNVKVFRLSGMDLVRGYDDAEINTLVDGVDISQKVITDKVFMVNLKLEPRFFISDNLIAGVFFDAGRVFVDEFKSNKLRSSYGITFKYLTPVGTLDFDYGIKTLRKKDSNGKLESPGRLHVSIGFF